MNLTAPLFARRRIGRSRGWDSEFCEPVRPEPGEIVIYKRSVSALAGTELDRLFRLKVVNTLVLTGVATHFAVEGTARDAVDRGYRVVVLEDCCASRVKEVHDFSINMILRSVSHVTTADSFIRRSAPRPPTRGRNTRREQPPRRGVTAAAVVR